MLHAIVMAGGSGVRFWPQSRRSRPKQLLHLTGERTMIQQTIDRVAGWVPADRTWIATNREQLDATAAQLPEIGREQFVIEPCGRNTAPCIGLAAIELLRRDPQAVMLVIPADHRIEPIDRFRQAIDQAVQLVDEQSESLVLFGIAPTYPATGFGYIERGEPLSKGAYRAASFREKPDAETARGYLESGEFLWNSGIFVWRAEAILRAIEQHEPQLHRHLLSIQQAIGTPEFDATLADEFAAITPISIDFAVLERADDVCLLKAPFDWDDVGSWEAVARLMGTDADGNAVDGPACLVDTHGCIVRTTQDHLVATAGLEDCIIVHTPDATLVARRGDEQAIRRLVARLEEEGHERFL